MIVPFLTLWRSGRNLHRPLLHSAYDYNNHPQTPERDISILANRGHFYFGLTVYILFSAWLTASFLC